MNIDSRVFNFESTVELQLDVGDINQVAEVSIAQGREYFEHTQVCDEFTYALSGQADIYSNGKCERISAGQIHFIRKGINHRIVATPDQNFRYICIAFEPNCNNASVKAFLHAVGDRSHFIVNDTGYTKPLCEMTVREFYKWDDYSAEMVDRSISQFLILLCRILTDDGDSSYNSKSKKNSSHAMYQVLRYIDKEYLNITSIKTLADTLSYSESYLSHLFSDQMGITLKEYINRRKIARAMELLRQCDLTVEQIANHLNFESARTFRRVFKQYTGSTPIAYRDLPR